MHTILQWGGLRHPFFTPFSTSAAWTRLYPSQPFSKTISARLIDLAPPTFPYLVLSISTSPTPATPPSRNSLSNVHVNTTTSLIVLMHQTLYKNATLMPHMKTRPPPLSVQQTLTSTTYKTKRLPFTKLYWMPPTTPLFLAQVATYNSIVFYFDVQNWLQTTQVSKNILVSPTVPTFWYCSLNQSLQCF